MTVSHKVMAPILILMTKPLAEALGAPEVLWAKDAAYTIWFLTQLLAARASSAS